MKNNSEITNDLFLRIIATTRIYSPSHISIQVPPNLASIRNFLDCGIDDLGGISPVTIDHINPDYAWPALQELESIATEMGVSLEERLPIYNRFIKKEGWVSAEIRQAIEARNIAKAR